MHRQKDEKNPPRRHNEKDTSILTAGWNILRALRDRKLQGTLYFSVIYIQYILLKAEHRSGRFILTSRFYVEVVVFLSEACCLSFFFCRVNEVCPKVVAASDTASRCFNDESNTHGNEELIEELSPELDAVSESCYSECCGVCNREISREASLGPLKTFWASLLQFSCAICMKRIPTYRTLVLRMGNT